MRLGLLRHVVVCHVQLRNPIAPHDMAGELCEASRHLSFITHMGHHGVIILNQEREAVVAGGSCTTLRILRTPTPMIVEDEIGLLSYAGVTWIYQVDRFHRCGRDVHTNELIHGGHGPRHRPEEGPPNKGRLKSATLHAG